MDFLLDNEILYNKRLMDYKDRSKREAVWAKFCENNLDKDACQKCFQSQGTLFGKVIWTGNGPETILTKGPHCAPSYSFSSQCRSGLIMQTGDCAHGTIPGYFWSRVNL